MPLVQMRRLSPGQGSDLCATEVDTQVPGGEDWPRSSSLNYFPCQHPCLRKAAPQGHPYQHSKPIKFSIFFTSTTPLCRQPRSPPPLNPPMPRSPLPQDSLPGYFSLGKEDPKELGSPAPARLAQARPAT